MLAERDFRRLLATRLTSQASDGVFQVALASLFFFSPERAATAGQVALGFATLLLPYSLAAPFAGVLLDRWRRRSILVWANAVRAGLVLAVAGVLLHGPPGFALYALVLACVSVNRFLLAGLSAALPHVVRRSDLVVANAVSPTAGTLAAVAGGGAGYLLSRVLGNGDAGDARLLAVAGLGYAAAAVLAARMAPDLLGPDTVGPPASTVSAVRGVLRDLRAGAGHVRRRPPAAHALAVIAISRFCYGLSTISAVLLYRNYFSAPADVGAGLRGLALAFAAAGAGFLVAAILTPTAVRRAGTRSWVIGCLAGAAVTETVFIGRLSEPLLLLGSFVLGIATQGVKIAVDTLVQRHVDDAYRGRVFSFYDVLFNVAFVGAAALAALVLPANGRSSGLYAAIAGGYAVTAAGYARASRRYGSPASPEPSG